MSIQDMMAAERREETRPLMPPETYEWFLQMAQAQKKAQEMAQGLVGSSMLTPAPASDLAMALNDMDMQLNRHRDLLSALSQRLEPVLRKIPVAAPDESYPDYNCPLLNRLQGMQGKIARFSLVVESIIDRLVL